MTTESLSPAEAQRQLLEKRATLNQGSTPTLAPLSTLMPIIPWPTPKPEPGDDDAREKEAAAAEQRRWTARILGVLLGAGVPTRYLDASLSQVSPAVRNQFSPSESVFITGTAGTGKTFLAAAILRAGLDVPTRRTVRMVGVPELLLKIQASFGERATKTSDEILDAYSDASTLVLDDLGAERTTEWALQTLYVLINRRWESEKQTIITSNLSLDELTSRLSDRIASRIAGMCRVIALSGRDRRIQG